MDLIASECGSDISWSLVVRSSLPIFLRQDNSEWIVTIDASALKDTCDVMPKVGIAQFVFVAQAKYSCAIK